MAARKNSFDEKLNRLRALGDVPEGQAVHELRKFLADDNAFFLGEAAKLTKSLELRQLEPDLVQACKKLLSREIADRGCIAKRMILDALVTFEAHVPDVYLLGLKYIQMEHSFGPPEDTAGSVRGLCAHALVRIDYPDAILEVAGGPSVSPFDSTFNPHAIKRFNVFFRAVDSLVMRLERTGTGYVAGGAAQGGTAQR